jgi:DNA-binding CsgD family transcriptional regulator
MGLSPQEREYLERQVRPYRVAQSLSERCRAILRCADGLPSKSVAAELGIHEHTVLSAAPPNRAKSRESPESP